MSNLQAGRDFKNREIIISQTKEVISNAGLSSKNISINKTREEKILLKNVIQSFNQLKNAIKDWELKYVLKSNIDGRVSFLDFWTEHQSVNTGDLVFTIVPVEHMEYIARLKTPSLNSGKIKSGQRVSIKLESYPETEFGVLQG